MRSVRRSYVDTPAGQVHVAEAGDGPPIVLLHQAPRSWDEFRELLPLLAPRVRGIALDTIGMGASDPLGGEHSIERYAEVVVQALDGLGLDRVHLLGHHTGGVIALEVAAGRPERVDHLVLSSTPFVDAASRERRRSRPPIDEVEVDEDGSHLTQLWRRRQAFYPPGRPDLLTRFVRDALAVADAEAGHRSVGRYRMEDRAPLVQAPTLCIGHDADPYAFPELEPLTTAITGARTAIVPGGMVPLELRADAVAALVLDFLPSSLRP